MERRETVSVNISDIQDCIFKKIFDMYPELKTDKDVIEITLESNVKFLLYKVTRFCDKL